jgi:hypothetical protein
MRENIYQAGLIKRIYKRFPGCIVEKNDTAHQQGMPDLKLLFVGGMWAMLEVKASADSQVQPNQRWYVEKMNEMAFCRFIYPENEEAVLNELEEEYTAYRAARVP